MKTNLQNESNIGMQRGVVNRTGDNIWMQLGCSFMDITPVWPWLGPAQMKF